MTEDYNDRWETVTRIIERNTRRGRNGAYVQDIPALANAILAALPSSGGGEKPPVGTATLEFISSENHRLRAALARAIEGLKKNLSTLEWTVRRCIEWDKAHGELDHAITDTRDLLSTLDGEVKS